MKTKIKDVDFKGIFNKISTFLSNHLYISLLLVCLLSHALTFSQNVIHFPQADVWSAIIFSIVLVFLANKLYTPKRENALARVVISVIIVGFVVYLTVLNLMVKRSGAINILCGLAVILLIFLAFRNVKNKEALVVFTIVALAFLIRFYYVYSIDIYTYQHDVNHFESFNGHFGYIQYIYSNVGLPNFDPRPVWQFYHPPLHHMICALWLGINKDIFGISESLAREGMQSLTLFYSMVILVTFYLILKHLKIKGIPLYTSLLIVAFHPSFILLSGSLNNDCLSIALMCLSILATLKWSEKPSYKGAFLIGLSVGLAMMAKLSAALVALPIGIILISRYIKDFKRDKKKLTLQYLLLGIVAFPLGLGYQIRNYFMFGVPVTYVQELGTDIDQFLGWGNFYSRAFDFSPYQLSRPFLSWASWGDGGYNEKNPLIALFKTSMFEETISEHTFPKGTLINFIAYLLFWVSIAIAIYATVSMVITIIKKIKVNTREMVLFGSMWLITLVSYYMTCFEYPFICTMSYRYATPLILVGAIFIGYLQQRQLESKKKGNVVVAYSVLGLAILFSVLAFVSYINVSGI